MVEPPTAAVLLPRFHATTLAPPPAADSTLAELAEGHSVVAAGSAAAALKVYSPTSLSVQDQTKFTPPPPPGTLAAVGDGPAHEKPPPPAATSVGDTLLTAVLLFTLSVTVTLPPWLTKLTPPVVIAVSRTGGPGS